MRLPDFQRQYLAPLIVATLTNPVGWYYYTSKLGKTDIKIEDVLAYIEDGYWTSLEDGFREKSPFAELDEVRDVLRRLNNDQEPNAGNQPKPVDQDYSFTLRSATPTEANFLRKLKRLNDVAGEAFAHEIIPLLAGAVYALRMIEEVKSFERTMRKPLDNLKASLRRMKARLPERLASLKRKWGSDVVEAAKRECTAKLQQLQTEIKIGGERLSEIGYVRPLRNDGSQMAKGNPLFVLRLSKIHTFITTNAQTTN